MKKLLAGILSAILGIFGLVAVDKTIETRVSDLEVEVSELREQVSAQNNKKTFKAGDEIKAPQEVPFTIECDCVYPPSDESGVWKYGTANVTVTSASAVIVAVDEDEASYAHYRYPYTVYIKVTGYVDPQFSGMKIRFSTSIDDIGSKENDSVSYATIAADGSFSFEDYDVTTSEEYLDALIVCYADISR